MNQYIGEQLDQRYSEFEEDSGGQRNKVVIDLILQAYLKDQKKQPEKLDPYFRDFATRQIRLFVFARHDSTSSTICICIYHLYRNPEALRHIREEHDRVFGKDLSALPLVLARQPHLANDLPYTRAAIKEALHHFPPARGIRQGHPDAILTNETVHECLTDEASVYNIHSVMQVAPNTGPEPQSFYPSAGLWNLVTSFNRQKPRGDLSRMSFENGPRNCIAQGLVMLELRVRELHFDDAYKEFDRSNPREGLNHYRGQRALRLKRGLRIWLIIFLVKSEFVPNKYIFYRCAISLYYIKVDLSITEQCNLSF
jgi:cytochrome P450